MEDKFQKKYRTTSFRRPNWDYGSHGLYFVTICTKDRVNYFGEIGFDEEAGLSLRKTEIAEVANENWTLIPKYHPFIELDEFVIMPNHIHGILFVNKPDSNNWNFNKFGPQSQNLPSIIRGYKSSVKTYATMNAIDFAWQSKYHDRVIRDEKEYMNIKAYIQGNPQNWHQDENNIIPLP